MTTIDVQPCAQLEFDRLERRNVFLYVVLGDVPINRRDVAQHNLVELDLNGGELTIEAVTAARLLFGHGDPINELLVAHGPFVMNTPDEIRQAIIDYQAGKFGAVPA